MRILVVDDERSLLMTFAANLELDGFDVTTAESGERALEIIREHPCDLVLSDIRMPGMNGVDLYRQIRAIRPDCPVVLMTGFAVEGLVRDAIAEGVFAVLPKPFDLEHVVGALTRAIKAPVVLIIDGQAPAAQTTADSLRAAGVRAEHGTTGEQAIASVRTGNVDVCVVDLGLAGMSAADLMDRIRAIDPSIVHIALAGEGAEAMTREAAAHGSFVTLKKPVDAGHLIEAIARARGTRPVR